MSNKQVSSLKSLGMILFYFMLGIYIHSEGDLFSADIAWGLVAAVLVVFVTPIAVTFLSWAIGLRTRTAVSVSLLLNSLGETNLTVQVLGVQAGILSPDAFFVLIWATIFSLFLSRIVILFEKKCIDLFVCVLGHHDHRDAWALASYGKGQKSKFVNHVAILGFNETAVAVAEYFRKLSRDVVVIDLDPALHDTLQFVFKGTAARKERRVDAGHRKKHGVGQATTGKDLDVESDSANKSDELQPAVRNLQGNEVSDGDVDLELELVLRFDDSEGEDGNHAGKELMATSGITMTAARSKGKMSSFSKRGDSSSKVDTSACDKATAARDTANSATRSVVGVASHVETDFVVNGDVFGAATNIISIFADPEMQSTWEAFDLLKADLVVSCMVDDYRFPAAIKLAGYLQPCNVSFMAICNSNEHARKLYAAVSLCFLFLCFECLSRLRRDES